jgi:2-hydroxy-3-keto-5-methylthiopentenyl-1-phosphate phosphatase
MSRSEPRIRIYCDFDGTITKEDVGDRFFEVFAGQEMWEYNACYRDGKISAEELYRKNCSRITDISNQKIDEFCAQFKVIPSFPVFVDWARENDFPLLILSDGLDVYIERLLAKADLDVPFRANSFVVYDDGRCTIDFPYSYHDCHCTANCKRNHLLLNSGDDDYIVYIGDGVSDFCPAKHADLVFAKDDLEIHCQENNISYRRFFDFSDITTVIEQLSKKKRLRKPKRAELLRKSVWMSG